MLLKVLLLLSLFAVIEISAIPPKVRLLNSSFGKQYQLTYTFGSPRPGEILAYDHTSTRLDYNYPSSVSAWGKTVQDRYHTINRAEIIAIQSSVTGDARITEGGIGLNALRVDINAYNTMHFQYTIKIYAVRAF
ncbi:uncharacterized protein LOC115623143 [Scaptodrosophila lebanonensis]|uniref:Uncharacterized protein LOC115623143 n=1 Tax=Drosophila lebanonensis TaxID=7225 RepID=A0A6J2TDZ3_DROLE|nr:uncharacterized protein LOC115623143 [Scaptodrosophila lebanonensis]